MKNLLIRADDLGYCESVNYGIARAVKSGIVRSVGVMPNMEWAEHGVRLLDGTDVIFTVHANICQGKPITDPKLIPSLVDGDEFKDKTLYREAKEDFVVLDEVVMEVEAQYLRLVELTGKKPFMVEADNPRKMTQEEIKAEVDEQHQDVSQSAVLSVNGKTTAR